MLALTLSHRPELGEELLTIVFLAFLALVWLVVLLPALTRARETTPLRSAERFRKSLQSIAAPGLAESSSQSSWARRHLTWTRRQKEDDGARPQKREKTATSRRRSAGARPAGRAARVARTVARQRAAQARGRGDVQRTSRAVGARLASRTRRATREASLRRRHHHSRGMARAQAGRPATAGAKRHRSQPARAPSRYYGRPDMRRRRAWQRREIVQILLFSAGFLGVLAALIGAGSLEVYLAAEGLVAVFCVFLLDEEAQPAGLPRRAAPRGRPGARTRVHQRVPRARLYAPEGEVSLHATAGAGGRRANSV